MSVMDDMLAWLTTALDRRSAAIDRFERLCNERHPGADTIDHLVAAGMWAMGWTVDGERARVEADRRTVEHHRPVLVDQDGGTEHNLTPPFDCRVCCTDDEDDDVWPCRTLRLLACGYRYDAPRFRPEWAPSDVEVTT